MSTSRITGSYVGARGRLSAGSRSATWLWELGAVALVVLWVAASLLLVYRAPQTVAADFGSSFGRAYLRGPAAEPEQSDQGYSFVWTGERADIVLPAAGSGWFEVAVRFSGWRPPGTPAARIQLGSGAETVTIAPPPRLRAYRLLLPAPDGDVDVKVVSNAVAASDGRLMGAPLDRVTAVGLGGAPPLLAGALLAAIAVGVYALLRRLAVGAGAAVALTLLAAALLVYGLYAARMLVAVGLLRMLVTLLVVHVLLLGRPLVRALYARAGLALDAREEVWLWRIFAAALLVKLGGVVYPHTVIFDERAHTLRVQWLLDGRFLELYRPGYTSYMGGTVGLEAGQFPYSPLWYLLVAPWTLTGLGIGDLQNGLAAVMDVSKLFLIHIIARVTTGSRPVGLVAAGLYNLLPMPYFLLSWGNYPTQFGLWAMLLATAFVVLWYERGAEASSGRRVFLLWSALLALSILSYTVVGVVSVSFFLVLGLLGLAGRGRGWGSIGGRRLRFIVAGIVAAELFCFAIYHVQFARAIVTETLPAIIEGTADRADNALDRSADERDNALANFTANNQFTLNHFLWPVLLLSAWGGVLMFRDPHSRRWWPLWVAWLAMFVVWTIFSALVADMVLKHVFIMMPLVSIFTAVALVWAWKRGRLGQAGVLLVLGYLAVEVVQRGHFYMLIKRHFT